MSRELGGRLRAARAERGLTQSAMAELLGMRGNAYQRLEAGASHHHEATLRALDEAMAAAGFDWPAGLAGELDELDVDLGVLERLDRIEAYMAALLARLEGLGHDLELIERLRAVLELDERER